MWRYTSVLEWPEEKVSTHSETTEIQGPEVEKLCWLLKPSKQVSQCCPPGKIRARRNFCFVWSWSKGRFPPHSALLPLASLPPCLPPSAGICGNSGKCSCPQLPLPGKAWEANLPGNSVSSRKILGQLSHLRNRTLLQEKRWASQKGLEWFRPGVLFYSLPLQTEVILLPPLGPLLLARSQSPVPSR